MKNLTIKILHLYSNDMNIYGDYGNILTIKKRLEWYGYIPEIINYNQGDTFPNEIDMIIGGGGQDSGQNKIQQDLLKIGPKIKELADQGVPMLVICGLYQLFGKFFKTSDGEIIKGINIFDIETYGKSERLIGNIITNSEEFGDIIGYENHSGQTFLGQNTKPFGQVQLGAGNNTTDNHEGARYNNVIGTYMHGSLLPKNPQVADFLIEKAVTNKFSHFNKINLDFDKTITQKAREVAKGRPR